MPEITPRSFGYAHSRAVMEGLKAYVSNRKSLIRDGYGFIEKPGQREAFNQMIALTTECGRDILYVDSIKEFAGSSLSEFKAALTAIHQAGMLICSLTEPNYDYNDYMGMLEIVESLEPGYLKNRQSIMAVAMCKVGAEIDVICENTGLSEADVFQAVADYKREQEQANP